MIVTLTANPSVDRTVTLTEPLRRGQVHRAAGVTVQPGGKGVNVARMMASFGLLSQAALFLGREDERLMEETLSGWGCGSTTPSLRPVRGVRTRTTPLREAR